MYGIAVDAVYGCSLFTVVAELGQTLFEITCDQRRRQQIVRGAAGTTGSGLLAGGLPFVAVAQGLVRYHHRLFSMKLLGLADDEAHRLGIDLQHSASL